MKIIFNIKVISILSLFSLLLFSSCNDAKIDKIESPHVYIRTDGLIQGQRLTVEDEGATRFLSIRSNVLVSQAVKINVKIDPSFLEKYNERYGTSYVMLPNDYYQLENNSTVIPVSNIVANPLAVNFSALSTEMNKSGLTYAVPITLESVDDSEYQILDARKSFLYIVTPIPYSDVPKMSRRNGMKMNLKNDKIALSDFTIEFLVKIDNLGLNRNNQILFNVTDFSTGEGGTGGELFTRFAADGVAGKWDKFQFKNQGLNFDATYSFKNNIWYHIACVNDQSAGVTYIYVNGTLDSRFDNPKLTTTVNSTTGRGLRFCGESDNDSYMRSNVQGTEIRLWSVARSASDIKNNMYGVDPETPGLEAYWKANEAEGNEIKDHTGKGNDGLLFGTPTWVLDQRVEVGLVYP